MNHTTSLHDMRAEVHRRLQANGEDVEEYGWVNNNRNYVVRTNWRAYFCKWSEAPFWKAGDLVNGLKKGPGLTVDVGTWMEYSKMYPMGWILFNWVDATDIYYQNVKWFDFLSVLYEQESGEWVRVINIKDVMPWKLIIN